MKEIRDPDVQVLAALSRTLEADFATEELNWEGSPFAWIKTRPSRQVGMIGERLIAGWLATKGFGVEPVGDHEADLLINRRWRAEVKFSTLWRSGSYKFQQLRDQQHSLAICLGISPFEAHCWAIPKEVILDRWARGDGISSQHRGRSGSDTAWLTVIPGSEPAWLREHGGRCALAAAAIERITGQGPHAQQDR